MNKRFEMQSSYKPMSECSFESYGRFPWCLVLILDRDLPSPIHIVFSCPVSDISQQDRSYLNGLHNILSNYISL